MITWLKPITEKLIKDINDKEWDKLQLRLDNNPESVTLYTYEIDVDTLKISSSEQSEEDYDEELTGYATYEESLEGNRVYAESLKNAYEAKYLVFDFCRKFSRAMDKVHENMIYGDQNENR